MKHVVGLPLVAMPIATLFATCGALPERGSQLDPLTDRNSIPFVMPWDDNLKGTATDVSFLNDAPAGKNGWIIARDGHFYEEKTGRRVRFLGTNLTAKAAFPTKHDADRIAGRLAKLGVNAVRFHHINNGWDLDGGTIWKPGRTHLEIDPAQLDKLDYFIAALKRNGIYSNINLQTSREYLPEMGLPPSVRELRNFGKKVDKFNERMIQVQEEYAKELLDRVNPYTGLKYADDPAIFKIEINNENSLVGWPGESPGAGLDGLPEPFLSEIVGKWNAWLNAKYGDDAALRLAWPDRPAPDSPSLVTRNTAWSYENQSNGDVTFTVTEAEGPADASKTLVARINDNRGPNWHVQAHLGGLNLENGQVYTVTFRAKANKPETIGIDARLNKPDWRFLGLGTSARLDQDWKEYAYSFRVANSEPDSARISFVLGDARAEISIADVRVRKGESSTGLAPGQSLAQKNIPLPPSDLSPRFADYTQFLADLEKSYTERMRRYLRQELGFHKAMIIDAQISWGGLTGPYREERSEYADDHAYWNHPTFLGSDWDPKNYRVDRRALVNEMAADAGSLGGLALTRIHGKPHSISEYCHPAPGDFMVEMMPLFAAFGALQDWDALYTFDWSATGTGMINDRYDGFFDSAKNPARTAFYPAAALMFRGHLIPPARETILDLPQKPWAETMTARAAWQAHGNLPNFLLTRTSLRQTNRESSARHNPSELAPTGMAVVQGPKGSTVTVDLPKAKALIGFMGGQTFRLGDFEVTFDAFSGDFAALTLTPLDNKPIEQSERLLLTIGARFENHNMGWNDERNSVSDQWGEGPVRAQIVPCSITLKNNRAIKVFYLDPRGQRLGPVEGLRHSGGTTLFRVSSSSPSVFYEITAR